MRTGMRPLSTIGALLLAPLMWAQPAELHSIVNAARQRVEAADFSATGHLVWVQPSGTRISDPITIKGHWFPGVLRIRAELGSGSKTPAGAATHALIEMRPDGESEIWIAHPGDKTPSQLPFSRWSEGPLGSSFSYEDFLEEQVFWPEQTFVEAAKFGARDCEVVKSTPGPSVKTHYSEVKTWFDRTIDFPVYVEKTVKETGAVKEFTSYGLRKDGGVWSAHQIEMKTRGQGGSTLLILDRGTTKANLKLNDFSPAQLTRF
jgi:Outer membrane lipoprotein-sorting protein